MNASLNKKNNIDQRAKGAKSKASLPPEGIAYLSDGTPLDQSSFQSWKRLKIAERIQHNSKHLRHSVRKWHELLGAPVLPSELYHYYCVFMHIPKAGGTTLQHIIAKNYLPNQFIHANSNQINKNPAYLYHVKRREVRPIVMGHFDRSCILYQLLCDRPIIHFTMFREPIKRVLSHYRYLRGNLVHGKHQEVKEMSLEEYASSSIREVLNKQTLRILGDYSHAAQMQSLNDPDPLFREAKQVLEHEFSLFGITEQYNQFLLMAKEVLRWEDIVYRRRNISSTQVQSDENVELNEAYRKGIKIIHERNQLDMKLYDFARQLFDNRYRELDLDSYAEEKYGQINQRYQMMISELDAI